MIFDKIKRAPALSGAFLGSFLFVFAGWLWAYLSLKGASTPLVVAFSNDAGILRTGSMNDLHLVAVFGALAVVINFMIALELDLRDLLWGKLLAFATAFLSVLLFIGFAAIISVN